MSVLKEEFIKYGAKTVRVGLVAGAGGNISVREGDTVWMKPSGIALDDMTSDDLCGMDVARGDQVAG